ncbi:MAG: signal peptidase I [Clostridia bacterium]|nr:signal peptidase I [Clostridia bacterium]
MNQDPLLPEEELLPNLTEPTPEPESQGSKFVSGLFDVIEMFAWSVFAVLIIFTFSFRLCRVDGESMENTLFDGESLLLSSFAYTPKQDDIIVFHLADTKYNNEKTLVKRVIATGGQTVTLDFKTGVITVDGKVYEDSHVTLKNLFDEITGTYSFAHRPDHHYDEISQVFSATVPEGYVFVMGDNRNNSRDSRSTTVGFVDERCILGKAVLRLSPFTVFD